MAASVAGPPVQPAPAPAAGERVLEVDGLKTYFYTRSGLVKAVDGVSFSLRRGELLAIVGESGCGKSVTALSLMRLVADPPGRIVEGSVRLDGVDLVGLDLATMREIRGKEISMIFQEPMTSLNPVMTIGRQIGEALLLHETTSRRVALARTIEMLQLVGIPEPQQRVKEYPHQLSGGMRQRAMIAMALACNPKVLIADEPTSALDVTIQAQILDLIAKLQRELGTAVILITHDLGVVAETAERVIVMYAGRKVEEATVERSVRPPAASLHARADELDPAACPHAAPEREGRGKAAGDSRHGAGAQQLARRLHICAALCARLRHLSPRISALRGKAARPFGRVLARRCGAKGCQWLSRQLPCCRSTGSRSTFPCTRACCAAPWDTSTPSTT